MDCSKQKHQKRHVAQGIVTVLLMVGLAGCQSAQESREYADNVASDIIKRGQQEALGHSEPFTIETTADTLRRRLLLSQGLPYNNPASLGTDQLEEIDHWPEDNYLTKKREEADKLNIGRDDQPIMLSLLEALQIGAKTSRDYQRNKEGVFQTALSLEIERDEFRTSYAGVMSSMFSGDEESNERGITNSAVLEASKRFENGLNITGRIAFDLAALLTSGGQTSSGILMDISASLPLLAGSGEHIVREPLTQAERNVLYSLWEFERFKRTFAVQVASDYLSVLQNQDQIKNEEDNYISLQESTARAMALAGEGRLPKIQLGQVRQDELSARDRWIRAKRNYEQALDRFKISLGLPTDAKIELDQSELEKLTEAATKALTQVQKKADTRPTDGKVIPGDVMIDEMAQSKAGRLEMDSRKAIELAFDHRFDLRVQFEEVFDAQRRVVIAADGLRAGLNLTANASVGERRSSVGSASSDNAKLRFDHINYSIGAELDMPWEKTNEQIAYRNSLISLEQSARDVQALEDNIKLDIRTGLRTLSQARTSFVIQTESVKVAEQRVEANNLFFETGRVEIRDVLESKESLVLAKNALTDALISYRIAELQLQRDMGVLKVNAQGLWIEYNPNEKEGNNDDIQK